MLKTLVLFLFMLNLGFSQTSSSLSTTNSLIDRVHIDKDNLHTLNFNIYAFVNNIETIEKKLMSGVDEYLGTPYRYGGMSKSGIDCSAFTQSLFYLSFDIALPRTASNQYLEGITIEKDSLRLGDLVFFHTSRRKFVGHVGIYLGDNKFVHSGRKDGVSIANLEDSYYKNHFIGAKRILK